MKLAMVAVVGLGLLAAISASVLVRALTNRPTAVPTSSAAEQNIDVIVAARALPAMSVITGDAVTVQKVKVRDMPEGAMTNSVLVVGKVLRSPVVAGEPIRRQSLVRDGDPVYLAQLVKPGMRAISVQLTDWSGMAGLLYPGSTVDVLVTFRPRQTDGAVDDVSTTLLQGLTVLAIGSQTLSSEKFEDRNPGPLSSHGQMNTRMVTLLVNPTQAQILQLALQNGNVALSMRNPMDTQRVRPQFIRASEIQTAQAPTMGQNTATDSGGVQSLVVAAASWMKHFAQRPTATPTTRPGGTGVVAGAGSAVDVPRTPSLWDVLIVRGARSETRSFKLPDSNSAEPAKEPSTPSQAPADGARARSDTSETLGQ